jgi:tRNA dimethylallyltransferase
MMNHGGIAVALVGPTASGKSALSHELAKESGDVEILCVDAMTVYKGMDIGTAKPSKLEQKEVPYHLIDLINPNEEFNVSQFQSEARDASDMVRNLGGAVLYVGGTGLYGRAVLDNLDIPGQFPSVRAELDEKAKTDLDDLYRQLQELDPLASSRMESNNERRITRALEVTLGSGKPFSSFGAGLREYGPVRVVQVGLSPDIDQLNVRIEERFRTWMEQGLLEEVSALASSPGGLSRTARQAVGYRELLRHIETGAALEECVTDAITQSRRLARRQRSWFNRDPRIEWFSEPDDAAKRLREVLSSPDGFVRD